MTNIDSLILGIVEGFTEFLPISSTGHLILAAKVLNLETTEFLKSFQIIIQLGAISAVVILYFKNFFRINDLKKIIIGAVPAAIIGLGLYSIIKNNLLSSDKIVIWAMLVGGLLLILFELTYRGPDVSEEEVKEITYKQAFFIGLFQVLAVVPGVSRSAATIIGGLLLGIPRKTVVEFSFLLAVPTIAGASALDIYHNPSVFYGDNFLLLGIGFITSFFIAIISIKFLLHYVKKNTFIPFGIYRVILALIFFFIII